MNFGSVRGETNWIFEYKPPLHFRLDVRSVQNGGRGGGRINETLRYNFSLYKPPPSTLGWMYVVYKMGGGVLTRHYGIIFCMLHVISCPKFTAMWQMDTARVPLVWAHTWARLSRAQSRRRGWGGYFSWRMCLHWLHMYPQAGHSSYRSNSNTKVRHWDQG